MCHFKVFPVYHQHPDNHSVSFLLAQFPHPHHQCPNPRLCHSLLDHCASILASISCSGLFFPSGAKEIIFKCNHNRTLPFGFSVAASLSYSSFADQVPTHLLCWHLLFLTLLEQPCTAATAPRSPRLLGPLCLPSLPRSQHPGRLPWPHPHGPYSEPLEHVLCGCSFTLFRSDLSPHLSLSLGSKLLVESSPGSIPATLLILKVNRMNK